MQFFRELFEFKRRKKFPPSPYVFYGWNAVDPAYPLKQCIDMYPMYVRCHEFIPHVIINSLWYITRSNVFVIILNKLIKNCIWVKGILKSSCVAKKRQITITINFVNLIIKKAFFTKSVRLRYECFQIIIL